MFQFYNNYCLPTHALHTVMLVFSTLLLIRVVGESEKMQISRFLACDTASTTKHLNSTFKMKISMYTQII